jgi:hypothetical protein
MRYSYRVNSSLFGSRLRTDTLVAIARLADTYPSELADVLGRRPIEIQRAVASLEAAGVVATRRRGNVRLTDLDPRFPASKELYALLLRMSESPHYSNRWNVRRRPRAMGKPL